MVYQPYPATDGHSEISVEESAIKEAIKSKPFEAKPVYRLQSHQDSVATTLKVKESETVRSTAGMTIKSAGARGL